MLSTGGVEQVSDQQAFAIFCCDSRISSQKGERNDVKASMMLCLCTAFGSGHKRACWAPHRIIDDLPHVGSKLVALACKVRVAGPRRAKRVHLQQSKRHDKLQFEGAEHEPHDVGVSKASTPRDCHTATTR